MVLRNNPTNPNNNHVVRSMVCILFATSAFKLAFADEYHPYFDSDVGKRTKRQTQKFNPEELTADYWNTNAQNMLRQQLNKDLNFNIAKNIIMFLGDGMSIPTLAAARSYYGQMQGLTGEESRLSFEDFPHVGLSKTYCIDKQVADSACSATAYLCGIKANYGTIGVSGAVTNNNCSQSNDVKNHVESLATWAQQAGKGTGIVTTSRITHASPAGTFAHVANREWECDADVLAYSNDPKSCSDIASQLVHNYPGRNFKVIFGGGRRKFLPKSFKFLNGESGQRLDGRNLIKEWLQTKSTNSKFIYDRKGLLDLDFNNTDHVLGLFESNHMKFHLDANHNIQPTLAEMTVAALRLLQKEEHGYFLFVEGARIDHGHHESKAAKALDETLQLAEAVRVATEMTDQRETLIVVTSDHAHTMTMSGYSDRGHNILGLNTKISDMDNKPYLTLNYANGPGYKEPMNGRYNLANDTFSKNYVYPGNAPLKSETHGGDDVGVFALGPWSHLLTGVFEQNVIPHIMAYASCIGNGITACWTPGSVKFLDDEDPLLKDSSNLNTKSVDTSVKIFH